MGLTRSDLCEIFSAYGMEALGVPSEQVADLIEHLTQTRKTWPALHEALNSDRHPISMTKIAAKIGMIIPVRRRFGLESYRHFLENLRHYDQISDEIKTLDLYDVYISMDPVESLIRYRDQDLTQLGFIPGPDRLEALRRFYQDHLAIYGEFSLETNSRSTYSTNAKVICYQGPGQELRYTCTGFLGLFDLSRGVVWKERSGFANPKPELAFHRLALNQLRQRILEKFEQWRNRDGFKQAHDKIPPEIQSILTGLEGLLLNETRNDISVYLGNPSF